VTFDKIKISKISRIYTTKRKFSKNFPISLSKIGEISPEKITLLARAPENFCKVRHRLEPPKENQLGHSQPLNRLRFSACDRKTRVIGVSFLK